LAIFPCHIYRQAFKQTLDKNGSGQAVFYITICYYSGCQKNIPVFKRFFLQPLIPQFRNSEHYYGKRYKNKNWKDRSGIGGERTGKIALISLI